MVKHLSGPLTRLASDAIIYKALLSLIFRRWGLFTFDSVLKAPSEPREASWASSSSQFELRFANDADGGTHFELLGDRFLCSSAESLT